MAEAANDLIYSVLQKMQEELAAVRYDIREMKGELTAIRAYEPAL
jgi:hypothetical protein